MNREVILGWGAPSIQEQFPELPDDVSDHFQKDSEALSRLRLRGYVTDNQRDAILKKLFKSISTAVIIAAHPSGGDRHGA